MVGEIMKKLALATTAAFALLASGTANAGVKDKPSFKVGGLVIVWGQDVDGGGTATNVVSDFYALDRATSTATDLIADDVDGTSFLDSTVVTGDLVWQTDAAAGTNNDGNGDGVLDASDTFAAFGIDSDTDVGDVVESSGTRAQFFVASNTRFGIQAEISDQIDTFVPDVAGDPDPLGFDNITFDMSVSDAGGTENGLDWGASAQLPHGVGADPFSASVVDLGDMGAATTVYTGTRRTAKDIGAIAAQSVKFETAYDLDSDLSTTGVQGYDLSMGAGEISATVTYTVFVP